jgi:hypothetical protein
MRLIVFYALLGAMKLGYICSFNAISVVEFGTIYISVGMGMEILIYRMLLLMLEGVLGVLFSWNF